MPCRFELKQTDSGKFTFGLKNAEGGSLLRSETYESRSACENGIESVKKNAPEAARYAREVASDGRPYFNLKAGNHQVIGTSPMFADAAAMEAAIATVTAEASGAEVVEA
jgi:uncharacterized protein